MIRFDYRERLNDDLAEQFKEQPHIVGLSDVIAKQMQDLWQFYYELLEDRILDNAIGLQLDRIGESVGITRNEARQMAAGAGSTYESDDEMYRSYIKYKISINRSQGTYESVNSSIHAQWGGEYEYHEDPSIPAMIVIDLERFRGNNISLLTNVPLAKPAGVGIKFRTVANEAAKLYLGVSMAHTRRMSFTVEGRLEHE